MRKLFNNEVFVRSGHNKQVCRIRKTPERIVALMVLMVPFSSSSVQTTKLNTVLVLYDKYVKINFLY